MDVSNSTGSGTDYRVVAGGAQPGARRGQARRETVEIQGKVLEVLRRGTLEPHTYVTIRLPQNPPCFVQFLDKKGNVLSTFSVPPESFAAAPGEKAAHSGEFLVVLTENGKGPHETRCCRRKPGRS